MHFSAGTRREYHGTTPAIKVNEVIRIGRRRRRTLPVRRRGLRRRVLGAGKLDNQPAFLAAKADQHHETNLRKDIVISARYPHADNG